MLEGIKVGNFYRFYLSTPRNKDTIEGEVTYKDDDVITIYNPGFGLAEFEIKSCISFEPIEIINDLLDLDKYPNIFSQ